MNTISRRQFLKLSAGTGLTVAGAGLLQPAARAIEPFQRAGAPRLMLSLAAYSFRTFFKDQRGGQPSKTDPAKQIDMFDFIDYCADHGCAGTELTSYFFPPEVTDDYLLRIRRHAFVRGIAISGTAVGNNFTHPKGEKRDAEIAGVKQWIDRAALMGAPHIRVFAGQYKTMSKEAANSNVISALEECCDYAGQKGIFLGIENHDSIGDAATLLEIVRAVNSPWFGVNLDTGNFRTDDQYRDIEETLPYAVNVQVKVEMRKGPTIEAAPADLPRLIRLMRAAKYQGFVVLEYEAKEDPWQAVPPLLDQMRQLMAG